METGEKVLCFDRLTQNLKHAGITNIHRQTGSVDWTHVTLTDGTSLGMTSDHPVQPMSPLGQPSKDGPIRASELQPEKDSLMVLKVVPVLVQSIRNSSEHRSYISVNVNQSERYSVFVAAPVQANG